jgi:hypothetical protein
MLLPSQIFDNALVAGIGINHLRIAMQQLGRWGEDMHLRSSGDD